MTPWNDRATDQDFLAAAREPRRHQLTFRGEHPAIPAGYGLCLRCGALVTIEEWERGRCEEDHADSA